MARLTYDSSLPIGQLIAEGINSLQEGEYKISRAAEAVTQMSEEEAANELACNNFPGLRSALNQIKGSMTSSPLDTLLPSLDQG